MSEPELCYCTGGNKMDQNFYFYKSLFLSVSELLLEKTMSEKVEAENLGVIC